jgi:protein-S-isoprenylcysteine O-methyltransferase Ste14
MCIVTFLLTMVVEIIALIAVIISITFPNQRIWPPNRERSWEQHIMLVLFMLSASGLFFLGIFDWDKFVIPNWIRSVFGLPLWFLGMVFGTWSMIVLGLGQSSGNAKELIRNGPYLFSRNPQYLGFTLGLVGWVILSNSAWILSAAFFGILSFLLVPFTEEPWLLDQFGSEYSEYKRTVPRFFGKVRRK